MSLATSARRHLRGQRHATLGTLSTALPGYPYCSVVPYVLDASARPVMLVSRGAEHTHNLVADPRVSLFVHELTADVQSGERVTLMGTARPVREPDAGIERYGRYFPQARAYREQLDFDYYRIEPVSLRVVAGFAKVHWISREAYTPPAMDFALEEQRVVDELNTRYAAQLRDYCAGELEIDGTECRILGVDCDGFDLHADERYWRRNFGAMASSAAEASAAVVRLLSAAPA